MHPEAAFAALVKARDILNELAIPYCLDGGTLIGFARNGEFIPDDKDIDITLLEQRDRMSDVAQALTRARFQNARVKNLGAPLSTLKVTARAGGSVALDIVNKTDKGGMAAWTIHGNKARVKTVPIAFYETLGSITIKGETFSVPADTTGYLAFRWGADWRAPLTGRAYNRFRSDRAYTEARNREEAP